MEVKDKSQQLKVFWKKYAVVYVMGSFVWLLIGKFYPRTSPPFMNQFGNSVLKESGLVVPALLVFAAIIILHLTINFRIVQATMKGNRYRKGFVYGAWYGLIWIWGFIEYHHFFGSNIFSGIWAGFGDFIPLVIIGVLIGLLFGSSSEKQPKTKHPSRNIIGLFMIPLLFTFGHYVFYRLVDIEVRPMDMVGIVIEIGLATTICIFFFYFRDSFVSVRKGLDLKREIYFIYVFFGINWALFNLYPLISRDIPLLSFGEMIIIDFLMSTLGFLLYKSLFFDPRIRMSSGADG